MAQNSTIVKTYKVTIDTSDGKVKVDGLTNGFVQLDTAINRVSADANIAGSNLTKAANRGTNAWNRMAKSAKTASKNVGQVTDKTGLAGAAVVELGRTISDSNYGFTAMANNISQLSTLMTTLIVTTGGVKQGAKAMWTALKGPLGVIVVFQIVVALLEKMALKQRKAKEESASLAKAIGSKGGLISELELLGKITSESSKESDEFKNALSQLKKKGFDPATQSVNDFIDAQIRLLKLQASKGFYEKEITKIQEELIPLKVELAKQSKNTLMLEEKALKAVSTSARGNTVALESALSARDEYNESLAKSSELTKKQEELESSYIEILKQINEQVFGIGKTTKETLEAFDIADDIRGLQEDITLALTESEEQKIRIKAMYYKQDLELALDLYEKKAQLLIDEGNLSEKQGRRMIADARRQTMELIRLVELQADSSVLKSMLKQSDDEWEKFGDGLKEGINKINTRVASGQLISSKGKGLFGVFLEDLFDGGVVSAGIVQDLASSMSSIFDVIDSEFERSLDSTAAYYTEQNNMLRDQLRAENLGADERRKIQKKIEQNDEKSRIEQEKIRKKQFKANKAMAIAEATVNTFLAATQALSGGKEGLGIAKIASAVAVITFGLAQVAMIARQKFVPSASSAPSSVGGGSGSSGDGDREFNFNLVGKSEINQLTDLLEDKLSQPQKAYVVSKDITTQQEMDLAIENQAKI